MSDNHKFDTKCLHAGVRPDPVSGAIMTPIYQTSTYVQESPGNHKGFEYSRTHNPTRDALEESIAALENAAYGIAFGSGCAASAACIHLLDAGDHVVASDDLYGGSHRLFTKVFARQGIEFTFTDLRDPSNLEKNIKPNTKMVWAETPTNPTLRLCDISALSKLCKQKNILFAVDNTFMSPYFQTPIDLGADIVMHSATKFINGHSDTIMGLIATPSEDLFDRFKFIQNSVGAVPSPNDCFLVLRGIKTLAVRMRQHERNAQKIATMLEDHAKVETVTYPGLKNFEQYELAQKQMRGSGGMITFYLKSDMDGCRRFLENVKVFALAESLGGVESMVNHPAIMTHASVPADLRKELGIGDNMVRLSVGIEDSEDLLHDLKQALDRI